MSEKLHLGEIAEQYVRTIDKFAVKKDGDFDELVEDLHAYEQRLGVDVMSMFEKDNYQDVLIHLQEKKAAIMSDLQEKVASLDVAERETEEAVTSPQEYTVGEIISNIRWGVDPPDLTNYSRLDKKRIYIAQARYAVEHLYDQQLIEINLRSSRVDYMKKGAYSALREQEGVENRGTGVIAEKIVENWLIQTIQDYQLPVKLEVADVIDDVEYKIDFLLRRSRISTTEENPIKAVDVTDSLDEVGIQFTVNSDTEVLSHKQHQIERVTRWAQSHNVSLPKIELVRVHLYRNMLIKAQKRWNEAGNPPGGPEQFLGIGRKREIFEGIFSRILTQDELTEYWNKIEQDQIAV